MQRQHLTDDGAAAALPQINDAPPERQSLPSCLIFHAIIRTKNKAMKSCIEIQQDVLAAMGTSPGW